MRDATKRAIGALPASPNYEVIHRNEQQHIVDDLNAQLEAERARSQ